MILFLICGPSCRAPLCGSALPAEAGHFPLKRDTRKAVRTAVRKAGRLKGFQPFQPYNFGCGYAAPGISWFISLLRSRVGSLSSSA